MSTFVKYSKRVFSKCLYFNCNALCSSQPLLSGHCTWIQGSSAKHVPTWLHSISDHQEHHQHHQDNCDRQGHHSDTVMTVMTVMAIPLDASISSHYHHITITPTTPEPESRIIFLKCFPLSEEDGRQGPKASRRRGSLST